MKNTAVILTSIILFASCGSKHDVEKEVKEMCECYSQGTNDQKKFLECTEKNEKLRESYNGDNEALAEYDRKLANCLIKK